MMIPQLTKYILQELEIGTPELEIKQKLFRSHWMPEEIEENYQYAFAQAQQLLQDYQSGQAKRKVSRTYILLGVSFLLVGTFAIIGIAFFFLQATTDSSQGLVYVDATPEAASGSPTPQPLIAIVNPLDRKRDQDRQAIQAGLVKFYEDNRSYPQRLSELAGEYLESVPLDPVTSNPYKYETLTDRQDYTLCMSFEEIGELCFNRLSN